MLSTETVRTAVLSPKPWSALDQLVREQLATGRLKDQIRDELISMEDQLLEKTDNNEDAADALHDIIDALAGMCPAKYGYENPPVVPTEEEISKLPRWARVAFAARCAMRVYPLLHDAWPDITEENQFQVKSTALAAETAAANGSLDTLVANVFRMGAADAAHHVSTTAINEGKKHAANIAFVASLAFNSAYAEEGHKQITLAWKSVMRSWELLQESSSNVARKEFDSLNRIAQWQHWTDDTPVPSEVFGPLWPEGPPIGWPLDSEVSRHSAFNLDVTKSENQPEQVLLDETMNIFNAVNQYHIARGGQPLTLSDLMPMISSLVAAGV